MKHFFSEKISEAKIQNLLETYPYLMDKRFLGMPVESQKKLKSGRTDIVVYLKDEIVIAELKKDFLDNSAVLQLNGYLEDVQQIYSDKKITGLLVGKKLKEDIFRLINILSFSISVKFLEKDIPINIKICENCRRANDIKNSSCCWCDSDSWLN